MFRLRCSYPNPEQAAWMAVTCAWCEYNLSSSNKRYDRLSDTQYLRSTQRLWRCNTLTRPDTPAPQLFLRVSHAKNGDGGGRTGYATCGTQRFLFTVAIRRKTYQRWVVRDVMRLAEEERN